MSKTFYCCGRCGKFFNGISYGIIKSKHYKKEFNISFFPLIDIQEKVVEEWLNYRYNNENIGV